MELKERFIERYSKLTDIDLLIEFLSKPPRKSVRVNTLKTTTSRIKRVLKLEQIPWCKEGFWVEGIGIGNLKEHFLGYIYLQEAASMIPALALDPDGGDTVLDMCAAPGSKTTHMAAIMKNKGIIVANDRDYKRLKPLGMNIQRCGVTNTIITLMDARHIKNKFTKILVDAPCSATGTIRKSYLAAKAWNPNTIKVLAGIQKRLVSKAFELLGNNGILVYSTCSLEPEENEGVIDYLLKNYDNAKIERINIKLKSSTPILEFEGKTYSEDVKNCLRIWPQDNDTDGFFIARVKKKLKTK